MRAFSLLVDCPNTRGAEQRLNRLLAIMDCDVPCVFFGALRLARVKRIVVYFETI